MKYDTIIVGAGPSGYFLAYELIKKVPKAKILLIDRGLEIRKRHCPVLQHKVDRCPVNAKGFRECHINPDWLLIYKKKEAIKVISLYRTGTHSDLF